MGFGNRKNYDSLTPTKKKGAAKGYSSIAPAGAKNAGEAMAADLTAQSASFPDSEKAAAAILSPVTAAVPKIPADNFCR